MKMWNVTVREIRTYELRCPAKDEAEAVWLGIAVVENQTIQPDGVSIDAEDCSAEEAGDA